jgi:hypothetical protein
VECDTLLESWKLQVYFKPHPNRKSKQRVMNFQSPEKKCHLNVSAMGKRREYYMGESDGFPRVQAVVSHVSLGLPVTSPSTANALECELTNLLIGLMQVRITK